MDLDKINIAPYEWGRGIEKEEWLFIESIIRKYKVKTVLEFGPGLSTLLFGKAGMKVKTLEDKEEWVSEKDFGPKCDVVIWDGKRFPGEFSQYDLALVDGPKGGESRAQSTLYASAMSNLVLIHDCRRKYEKIWQGAFLESQFQKVGAVKNICLWKRRGIYGVVTSQIKDGIGIVP